MTRTDPRAALAAASQVALLAGLWGLGAGFARLTGLPVPGGVVGLALALALLASGRLPADRVGAGAGLLLAHLGLFFVPAVVVVIAHPELRGELGLRLLAVMAGGTLAVMAATAVTVELVARARDGGADG